MFSDAKLHNLERSKVENQMGVKRDSIRIYGLVQRYDNTAVKQQCVLSERLCVWVNVGRWVVDTGGVRESGEW